MSVCWLIDEDMFERYRDELVEVVRQHGYKAKLIQSPKPGYSWDDEGCSYRDTFEREECVVVHGDIDLATRVHHEQRWTPGAFAAAEKFHCASYYCHFGEYLLNDKYIMLPFAELGRCRSLIFDSLAVDDTVFVRPDSPLKLFAGQTATRATFDADLEFMGFYDFPPESLAVVSPPKQVAVEWRFVVADGEVVAGTEYSRAGVFGPKPEYDEDAHALAVKLVGLGYEPEPVWIIDICQTTDDAYHLLEIGAFSFADLYAVDKKAVVEAVSASALRVWQARRSA